MIHKVYLTVNAQSLIRFSTCHVRNFLNKLIEIPNSTILEGSDIIPLKVSTGFDLSVSVDLLLELSSGHNKVKRVEEEGATGYPKPILPQVRLQAKA